MKKLLLLPVLLLITACARSPGEYDTFAQCLTDKGIVMYGSDTCPHCTKQKQMFSGSFDLVTYIECRRDPGACEKADIQGYPTWMIEGKKHTGARSLSELSELSKCELK